MGSGDQADWDLGTKPIDLEYHEGYGFGDQRP